MINQAMDAEKQFLVNMLLVACRDLARPVGVSCPYTIETIRRSARRWFKSDYVAINSFVGICKLLKLDPDYVRDKIFSGQIDWDFLLSARGKPYISKEFI